MAPEPRTRWGIALTIGVLALIGWLTLRSAPEDAEAAARSSFLCIWPCHVEGLRDIVLNVVMFIPLGLVLRTWLPPRLVFAVVVAATIGIELSQYLFLLGRDASLRDLLTNVLGGLIGAQLAEAGRTLVRPTVPQARRLAAAGLGGWLLIVALTAFGVRPSLPSPPYWGQHTAQLGQFALYYGTLLDARINGHPFPGGRAEDSEAFGALIASDSLRVEIEVVSGPPPEAVAPIVSVFNDDGHQVLVLGQGGRDLVFVRRTGLEALEFAGQNLVLPNFPGADPGDTVAITAGVEDGEMYLTARGTKGSAETRLKLSAGWLWSGLNPFFRKLPPNAWIFTALWLGFLMLPGGYWLGRATARAASLLWLLLPVTVGLAGATGLAGLRLGEASEWIGSLAGGGLGWLAGRWSARRWPAGPGTG